VHGGQAVVLLVLVLLCGGALLRTVRRARGVQGRPRARGRAAGGWLAHRRSLRLERVRAENAAARDEAKHRHRLAEQEARKEGKAQQEPGPRRDAGPGDGRERPGRRTVRSRVLEIGGQPVPPGPAAGRAVIRVIPIIHLTQITQEPPARGGEDPPADRPPPGPPSPQPSRGSTVTVPFAEQVVDGINGIAAHVRAGNILAKRRGMLALIAICKRAADMALSLSRALAEPGQHYGPEVTEPIAKGSMHLRAAGLAFAEADTALSTLLRASLAETMESGRQVPHHDEFAEGGAYHRGGTVGTAPPNTFVDPARR